MTRSRSPAPGTWMMRCALLAPGPCAQMISNRAARTGKPDRAGGRDTIGANLTTLTLVLGLAALLVVGRSVAR